MHHQEHDFAAVSSAFEVVPSRVRAFERLDRVAPHRPEAVPVHHDAGPSAVETRVDRLDGHRFLKATTDARAATGGGQRNREEDRKKHGIFCSPRRFRWVSRVHFDARSTSFRYGGDALSLCRRERILLARRLLPRANEVDYE